MEPITGGGGSSGCPFVTTRDLGGGISLITIAKEPVNSFDTAMWRSLHAALRACEADASCRAVVFASGLKRDVFTAGNDLRELYAPATSGERYRTFWVAQNELLCDLFCSRLATVAAIRGACPAGGTGIAMACDVRLITPNGTMGLNEVALGIPVPKFWAGLMARLIGQRAADDLVLNGRMVDAARARELGLVDEMVEGAEALMAAAVAAAKQLAKLPPRARASTKAVTRTEYCEAWQAFFRGPEPTYGWEMLQQPDTVKQVGTVLQRLSGSGKAPPSNSKL